MDDPADCGEQQDPEEPGDECAFLVRNADVAEAIGHAGDGERDCEKDERDAGAEGDGRVAEGVVVAELGHDAEGGPDGAEEDCGVLA